MSCVTQSNKKRVRRKIERRRKEKQACFYLCLHMASLDFIPERAMWVGANTATVAIVDGGETRTLASLRGHCVCYWWAAGDYGYSQRLSVVYGSESRCCKDKDPTCEYTTTPPINTLPFQDLWLNIYFLYYMRNPLYGWRLLWEAVSAEAETHAKMTRQLFRA